MIFSAWRQTSSVTLFRPGSCRAIETSARSVVADIHTHGHADNVHTWRAVSTLPSQAKAEILPAKAFTRMGFSTAVEI